jgi:hypothetical protein
VTDSAGLVAVREPALAGQSVFFHVRSHGYEYPADGFGFRGRALRVTPGGSATLRVKRINLAERLYRVTGTDIYRDSVLLERPAPIAHPLSNAQVAGSDSVNSAVYRDSVIWFWGDTNRLSYPLGAFHVPAATSRLPADGGLPIERGVDLQYFTRDDGFVADTCHMPGDGPTWIDGVCVVNAADGHERLFAKYMKVRKTLEVYERGLAVWNDDRQRFEKVATFDFDAPLYPRGHALLHRVGDTPYVYFGNPHPTVRVPANPAALADTNQYEAFTCLAPGSTLKEPRFDRDEQGRLRWAWKHNAPAARSSDLAKWVDRGLVDERHSTLLLRDIETGRRVVAHAGSVAWNAFRQRYVTIFTEVGGSSYLGETWYAEADTPLGPWVDARKIVTHDKYSFYNPRHHPMFDERGGRRIYFEGTYSKTFSGAEVPTPRYDYNQIMYALDLTDPRLMLPVAVYQSKQALSYGKPVADGEIAFMALDRPRENSIAIVRHQTPEGQIELLASATPQDGAAANVAFYALPAVAENGRDTEAMTPLFAWRNRQGQLRYAVSDNPPGKQYVRDPAPLCRVWKYPLADDIRFAD